MPEIRINLEGFEQDKTIPKKLSKLEELIKAKPTQNISKDLNEIKRLLAKRGESSFLEKRLGIIEGMVRDVLSINRKSSSLMDKMDIPEFNTSKLERMISSQTSTILDALKSRPTSPVNLRPIKEKIDDLEDTLLKKIARMSLPRTTIVQDRRPQIVPSPS